MSDASRVDSRGVVTRQAGGKSYRLMLGMSGLADLQGRHGQDVFAKLDVEDGQTPDMAVIVDIMVQALQRFHGDEADKYLADDLLAEHGSALIGEIIQASFPDAVVQDGGADSAGKTAGAKA